MSAQPTEGGLLPHREVKPVIRGHAKRMRRKMTDAERKLWGQLRAHRLDGLGFRRQMPFADYVADFGCPELRIIVEIDGSQHAKPNAAIKDRLRTEKLGGHGWLVIRFWNNEVLNDLSGVCDHIVSVAGERRRQWEVKR